jgi:hypothetical protein
MSAKRREVWVEVTPEGDPVFSISSRRVFVWAEQTSGVGFISDENRLVRYVPAPTPRKRRKR